MSEPPMSSAGESGFRADIEGLRAVAVMLVLVYHAGVKLLPGGFVGVDAFFVISGFLITGLLVREVESAGSVALARFWARRAKRLLPATALVLVATAALTWRFLPVTQQSTFAGDIVAAALYVVNWRLADRSVDYLAEDVGPSPVQHFWSLAVEEQFYLIWPLLLAVVAWRVTQRGANIRSRMAFALAIVAIPSFAWSVHLTSKNPATAFFVSTTRLWELAIGAAVAIGARHWARLPRRPAVVLGWLGLLAIVGSGFLFREGVRWPGYRALLPTLGAAAVIVAGSAPCGTGVARFLGWRPMVWVGGLSYSLYLWHWPLVVVATAIWGELGAVRGLAVIVASFPPAWLSRRFIENPIRFSETVSKSSAVALGLGLVFTLIGAGAGLGLALRSSAADIAERAELGGPDSESTDSGEVAADLPETAKDKKTKIRPNPRHATRDVPSAYAEGCQLGQYDEVPMECTAGDKQAERDILIAGDSKMMQWHSAFDALGRANHWRIRTLLKSSCAVLSKGPIDHGRNPSCEEWNKNVFEILKTDPPDILVTSQQGVPGESEQVIAGLAADWLELEGRGIEVVVLVDNPAPKGNMPECVARKLDDADSCVFPRAAAIQNSGAPIQLAAAAQVPSATVIDLTPDICAEDPCHAVVDNTLLYRQRAHLTDTFVRKLTPRLTTLLEPLLAAKPP